MKIDERREMLTIGLLGGMSWESTLTYYQAINQGVKAKLGGLHSAKIAMLSIDFAELEKMQIEENWSAQAELLVNAALKVEAAGADFLLICTNTMHKMANDIQAAISIPILHIADATAEGLRAAGIQKVALLGTAYTMEQNFYKGRLVNNHGLEVLVPNQHDRSIVHEVIYQELCAGQVLPKSKQEFLRIVSSLANQGAEGIILGCTEIGLLLNQQDTEVRLFDTTLIHAQAAVERALKHSN